MKKVALIAFLALVSGVSLQESPSKESSRKVEAGIVLNVG